MPKEFSRKLRIEEMVQRELATLIQQEIKDPRVGIVTVTGVDMSPDLKHAKIYVTILGNENDCSESVRTLNHAARFLRHELARRLYLKAIPDLRFVYDASAKEGARLAKLIDTAIAHENEDRGQNS